MIFSLGAGRAAFLVAAALGATGAAGHGLAAPAPVLAPVLATVPASVLAPRPQEAPGKRALIVAIADYPEGSGYGDLSSANDVPLVKGALLAQGFAEADIRVLADQDATREGIVNAIREHLIEAASPGDVVFFHYSGHGHRITDDDGDELDGYDEILVPWGASAHEEDAGEGEKHIRDDEMNELVAELRARVGPGGNVVISLDNCNSGSATRGLPVRGMPDPIGPPAGTARGGDGDGGDHGSGLYEAPAPTTRGGGAADSGLAPYIVFSAARHDEPAREVRDDSGNPVGSLSYALSKALADVGPGATYRALFDRVKTRMASLVPIQTPQMEGDADTEVFSGRAVEQRPYVTLGRLQGDTAVVLNAGTLLGIQPGTEVAVHPAGTSDPEGSAPLATGTVSTVSAAQALLRLDGPGADLPPDAWAFVSRYDFGDLAVGVRVDGGLSADLRGRISGVLDTMAVVREDDVAPDLSVEPGRSGEGTLEIRAVDDDRVVLAPVDVGRPDLERLVATRVRSFARNRYLSKIEMEDRTVLVRLEIVPAVHEFDFDGACVASTPRPVEEVLSEGGQWRFRPGDGYLIRLHNEGLRPAYVSILSLSSDGSIGQLFPLPELSGQDNYLEPGDSHTLDLCYSVDEPYGVELLKLFATRDRVDFWPILEGTSLTRGAGEELSPLERMLADVQRATRSRVSGPPRATGTTYGVTLHVVRDGGMNP